MRASSMIVSGQLNGRVWTMRAGLMIVGAVLWVRLGVPVEGVQQDLGSGV